MPIIKSYQHSLLAFQPPHRKLVAIEDQIQSIVKSILLMSTVHRFHHYAVYGSLGDMWGQTADTDCGSLLKFRLSKTTMSGTWLRTQAYHS